MGKNTFKREFKDYVDFTKKIGHQQLDGVDVTHDGYPLSPKEAKFIDLYLVYGNINKALDEAGMKMRNIAGKDYISDEIKWRMEQLKSATIADADEIMQYFTAVMRGQVKDQFGLDAPLSERTSAAKELARRVIDVEKVTEQTEVPEIKITLNWEGM